MEELRSQYCSSCRSPERIMRKCREAIGIMSFALETTYCDTHPNSIVSIETILWSIRIICIYHESLWRWWEIVFCNRVVIFYYGFFEILLTRIPIELYEYIRHMSITTRHASTDRRYREIELWENSILYFPEYFEWFIFTFFLFASDMWYHIVYHLWPL